MTFMQMTRPERGKKSAAQAALGGVARVSLSIVLFMTMAASLLLAANRSVAGDAPALTEYQVKALFLLNFAKYVDWPAEAFADDSTPITIGIIGQNKIGDDLKNAVAGKTINGRSILVIPQAGGEQDFGKCHVLFISGSEKQRVGEVLAKLKGKPILTVGETEEFIHSGGMIKFIKKEGKVRLEIGLDAAREAKLQISSKLLSVADNIHRKP